MLLKIVEINKKILIFRNDRHFLEKNFKTTKFRDRAQSHRNFENQL